MKRFKNNVFFQVPTIENKYTGVIPISIRLQGRRTFWENFICRQIFDGRGPSDVL